MMAANSDTYPPLARLSRGLKKPVSGVGKKQWLVTSKSQGFSLGVTDHKPPGFTDFH